MNTLRILCVDTDAKIGSAIREMLSTASGIEIVAEALDAASTLSQLKLHATDVVLLDLASRGIDGAELTRQIRQSDSNVRVLVFTASDSATDIFNALNAGADGYLLKGSPANNLERALRSVKLGTVFLDPGIAKQVLDIIATSPGTKTQRELPTGVMTIPLMREEKELLSEVASGSCVDGVCMVDPSFVKKLRRFAPGG